MKKLYFLFIVFLLTSFVEAGAIVTKTANCTPGSLSTVAASYLTSVTHLIVTGSIDARDFKTMRDDMPVLTSVYMKDVSIAAYNGTDGCGENVTTDYQANKIPDFAFSGVYTGTAKTSLTSFTFPTSVTSIGVAAFAGCTGLTGQLSLPLSLNSLGLESFYCCSGLTGALIIPSGVIDIPNSAFYGCGGFTSLALPQNLKSIGVSAFEGCGSFSGDLLIPNGCETVSSFAFYGCGSFNGILQFPQSITFVGDVAFYGCSNLSKIYAYSTTPYDFSAVINVFGGVNKTTCELHIPIGTTSLYLMYPEWTDFVTIVDDIVLTDLKNQTELSGVDMSFSSQTSILSISNLPRTLSANGNLFVTNLSGSVVYSCKLGLDNSTIDLSLDDLENGVYIVTIQIDSRKISKRILAGQ